MTDVHPPAGRDRVADYVEKTLVGPVRGDRETLPGAQLPHYFYSAGILFPPEFEQAVEDTGEEDGSGTTGEGNGQDAADSGDDPVSLASRKMPASMGVSFYVEGDASLRVEARAGAYARPAGESKGDWHRQPLGTEAEPSVADIAAASDTPVPVLNGRARIHVRRRPAGEGQIVTVTLVNASTAPGGYDAGGEECLFQAGFRCLVPNGQIRPYPMPTRLLTSDEDAELELQYRAHLTYAVGHGCAAVWGQNAGGETGPGCVATAVLPRARVQGVTPDLPGGGEPEALRIGFLSDPALDPADLCAALDAFVDTYAAWTDDQTAAGADVGPRLAGARDRLLEKQRESLARMRSGVARLGASPLDRRAFRLANLAMLMQMRHSRTDLGGGRFPRRDRLDLPEHDTLLDADSRWRPFQLAFMLQTLDGLADPEHSDRDLVDLIWFPTGGGKTEAYLLASAFVLFRRRLAGGASGGGTAIITRYTLRVLTTQQFQRTSRLICGCEILRRQEPDLGQEPFTIGFWAGGSTSPNQWRVAEEAVRELIESDGPNRFQVERCPWCGTELVPARRTGEVDDYGFRADTRSFTMFCPTSACPFHDALPMMVVDESLYKTPPSFLIATVDKFAMLAWNSGPGVFFGGNGVMPPSLVIQDELHLLSGPLGTVAALYETAVSALIRLRGAPAKLVASTATIRSAGEQVRALYDREVRVFPAPGLEADDSFFARTDLTAPGRLYVGYMSANLLPSTGLIRSASALLQAPDEVSLDPDEDDAYRTLVVYHLSLRDLGRTRGYARDDIPANLEQIAEQPRPLDDDAIEELTSRVPASRLPEILERLEIDAGDPGAVHLLASTNMISVGVDVPRLGLMLMHGQPKTTSEYIQATSRVGRQKAKPGLVLTHYASNKARDRSHYETFSSYHGALYRQVEPTSVTPFSASARDRALHAALVILVRHGVPGMADNDAASNFRADAPAIRAVLRTLGAAADRVDPREAAATKAHIERLAAEWEQRALVRGNPLVYSNRQSGVQFPALLRIYMPGDRGRTKGWPTLMSMRNVDRTTPVFVRGKAGQ